MVSNVSTDPSLDLRKEFDGLDFPAGEFHLLGAHVGGGDPRIPFLRDAVGQGTFTVPKAVHRSDYGYDYGMLANDQLGDCVAAEVYHAVMHALKGAGKPQPRGDDQALVDLVVQFYSAVGGYVPGDPSTDQGLDPTQAYARWQQDGILLPDGTTHRIGGVAQIRPADGVNLRRGIYEFDSVGLSLAMPTAWQGARIWDVGGDPNGDPNWQPGSWGGHQVLGVSFDSRVIAVVTWGGIKLMTWRAWGTYGQLGLVAVSEDQINQQGVSETGVNYAQLAVDLPSL